MTTISIIIINYNTKNLLIDCIHSIVKETKDVAYEIIVIDNCSTDGSKEYFSELKGIQYYYLEENLGFGRANNYGVTKASGDILFFLNSDTILLNNAVSVLYNSYISEKNIGIAGANLFDISLRPAHSFFRYYPSIFTELNNVSFGLLGKLFFGKNLFFNHTDKILDVAFVTGADLMISKSLFEKVNGFDSDFFMYFEETDLSFKIKQLNYRIVSVPSAKIIHLEGASEKIKINTLRRYLTSKKIYYSKRSLYKIYKLSLFLSFVKASIKYITLFGKKQEKLYWKEVILLYINFLK